MSVGRDTTALGWVRETNLSFDRSRSTYSKKDGDPQMHHDIRPVTRDCVCPTMRATAHTKRCNAEFREKFLGAWGAERANFYRPTPVVGHDGAFGLYTNGPDAMHGEAS